MLEMQRRLRPNLLPEIQFQATTTCDNSSNNRICAELHGVNVKEAETASHSNSVVQLQTHTEKVTGYKLMAGDCSTYVGQQ